MDLAFDYIGHPGYGVSTNIYEATIPLKDVTTTAIPLFVIPKGSTVLAVKTYLADEADGTVTVNIGTYNIADTGAVGTAIDADGLVAAAEVTADTAVGTVYAKAATANNLQFTQDVVVQVVASDVTKAATKGSIRIEVATLL